jgi:proline dehydrogenase
MLRAFLITLSKLSWAQRLITRWKFSWRMAARFIAGESQADAIEVVRRLNTERLNATLDFLGENVNSPEEAALSVQELVSLLGTIEREKVRANISVKLSQMGLNIATALCRANMVRILDTARRYGNFVRIDMEDSSVTQRTIDLYVWLRSQGYENVGIVIQSYLYRSVEDVECLRKLGPRIRIVKGAYKEPADLAFPAKKRVDENFDRITAMYPPFQPLPHMIQRVLSMRFDWLRNGIYPYRPTNFKCCMASAAICNTSLFRRGMLYGYMCPTERVGTLILCAAWQSARRTCAFSYRA